jgi:predicted DNA binding CopG/RHH family protein
MRTKKVEAEDLGDYDMPAHLDKKIEAMTEQSEREIAAIKAAAGEIRVNFRWDATHLDIVKKAAELQGMPYQAYIKDCIFRRAIDDLDKTQRVLTSSLHASWSVSED